MPLNQAQVQAGSRIKSTAPATAEWGTDSLEDRSFSGNRLDLFSRALSTSGHKSITRAAAG